MYIFEIFVKWLNKNKRGNSSNPERLFSQEVLQIEQDSECQHNFMPVDSTGEVLACTKCGFVVKKRDK